MDSLFLNADNIEFEATSTIDDVGRVFYHKGKIYRGIYPNKVDEVIKIFNLGVVNELYDKGYIPKTWITNYKLEGFGMILESERIQNITFQYEWSYSMLKDAAKIVLCTMKVLLKHNYILKDCHPYNVLFDGCEPRYADLDSIRELRDDFGWCAKEEFERSYIYTLYIWGKGCRYLARRSLSYSIGFMEPKDFYAFKYGGVLNISHKWIFYPKKAINKIKRILVYKFINGYFNYNKKIKKQIYEFEKRINKLNCKGKTIWGDYQFQYIKKDKTNLSNRFIRIGQLIKEHGIQFITEIAGNQGIFTKYLVEEDIVKSAICIDYDELAIDILYNNVKSNRELSTKINPVVLNIINPIEEYRVISPNHRLKNEAVVALAITHHLMLSQNIALNKIFDIFSQYGDKYLITEFMPLGLYDGISETAPIPDWYNIQYFKNELEKKYQIIHEEKLEINRILFICTKNVSNNR